MVGCRHRRNKEGIKRKERAWKKKIQKDVPHEKRERRMREYRKVIHEVKHVITEPIKRGSGKEVD